VFVGVGVKVEVGIATGPLTTIGADAGPPGGASTEVTVLVVFVQGPAVTPVTTTLMVQLALAAREPFVMVTDVFPIVVPEQVEVDVAFWARVIPAG
jgi:hypothetical protein